MYAVEFQAPIKNGIVHIPKEYKDLLSNTKATFVAMYDSVNSHNIINNKTQKQLDEFDRLVAQSDNKVMATMELDGIL